jgi:hypothetical protein
VGSDLLTSERAYNLIKMQDVILWDVTVWIQAVALSVGGFVG